MGELIDMIQAVLPRSCGVQAKISALSIVDVNRVDNNEIRDRVRQESVTGFERGYLEDTLDKTNMIDEQEQVNEKEQHSKGVEDEGSFSRQLSGNRFDNNQQLTTGGSHNRVEELIPGAHSPLRRVRKVAAELMSDALIKDTPKRLKNRMSIDEIENHFVGSREKPDSLAAAVQVVNCDVEDVVARCMTTSAQCISTPLLPGYIPLV
ncbi:hypothetical protein Cgig2_014531 [Carnegiea gigantea]|uniref:Uncharacterized protein n=1 Tax=Carnegiea gigantea TaxID=171969 RepID=A0A9Q1GKC1_9CARY|nr:hypothetical protein Cgig2_014531 [Carnegiea gigantea]